MKKSLSLALLSIILLISNACTDSDAENNALNAQERCEYLGICDDLPSGGLTPEEMCEYLGICDEVTDPDPDPDPTCERPCTELGKVVCMNNAMRTCTQIDANCKSYLETKRCAQGCMGNVCKETLSDCPMVNNAKATIVSVTDGDTFWVMINGENCLPKKYNIRIHGIDAPECYKERNAYFYYVCVKNSYYTDSNEPYGYESMVAANDIVRRNIPLTISCDYPMYDGTCPMDGTGSRYLAYVSVNYKGQEVDFSTEMARQGMAFSFTQYASKKRAQICRAQNEAIANKAGVWSLGSTDYVISQMIGKKRWLQRSIDTCEGY